MFNSHRAASIPRTILVPTDFSPSSEAALQMATDLAIHFHAGLYLLHVLPVFASGAAPDFFPEKATIERVRKDAEARLTAVTASLAVQGLDAMAAIEEANDVATSILEVAVRSAADLVVISTHGLTGWRPLLFGSIADRVLKLVERPILLLRSPRTAAA